MGSLVLKSLIMNSLVLACVLAVAAAGDHIALAPVNNDVQAPQIANAYLDDVLEVAEAKAAFDAEFKSVAAGGLAAKQAPAPVHEIPEPVEMAVAPVAYTAYHHAYPYTYGAYPHVYAGASLYSAFPHTSYAVAHPYTYTLPHYGLVPTVVKPAEE